MVNGYHKLRGDNRNRLIANDPYDERVHYLDIPVCELFEHNKCRILSFCMNPTHSLFAEDVDGCEVDNDPYIQFQDNLDCALTVSVVSKPSLSVLRARLAELNGKCEDEPVGIYDFEKNGAGKQIKIFGEIHALKVNIAEHLSVNPHQIEIFEQPKKYILVKRNNEFLCAHGRYRFDVVSYDTSLMAQSHTIYLRILHTEPYLFYDECDAIEQFIAVRAKFNDFTVNNLVDWMMDTIKHKMYGDEFKDFTDLYAERKDDCKFVAVPMSRSKAEFSYIPNEKKVNVDLLETGYI